MSVQFQEWLRLPRDGEQLSSCSFLDCRREREREMLLFSTSLPASWSVQVTSRACIVIFIFPRMMKTLKLFVVCCFSLLPFWNLDNCMMKAWSSAGLGYMVKMPHNKRMALT